MFIERTKIERSSLVACCYGVFSVLILLVGCVHSEAKQQTIVKTGADNYATYLPMLKGKQVGLVTNQTGFVRFFDAQDSVVSEQHLVDFLLEKHIDLKAVFAPEHGFRGKGDAGEVIKDNRDAKTGLPIYSLHGKFKKPQPQHLKGIDCIVFDIQDVGVRFYTYISTLHYVLEACAEQGIAVVVLDRPNPNGHYIDGPVLDLKYQSFLGMHPVPVVYGMTIGEFAQMIVGEKWLNIDKTCNLTVVPLQNWTHDTEYILPLKPSPNLPNATAVNLYPSLCFFEQTTVSVGRGTDTPFQIYGSPSLDTLVYKFCFKPKAKEGARNPKYKNILCYGKDLSRRNEPLSRLEIEWLLEVYQHSPKKKTFFKKHFEYLSGTDSFREQIKQGWTADEIRACWKDESRDFKKIRKKYLLYPDFQ